MRVFLTGATGYIGRVITEKLLASGHVVLGLARSDESAEKLRAMGAEVHPGNLDDLDSLKAGAASAEAVIHTAISLDDFNDLDTTFDKDERAVEAMLSALEGTDRPFLYTSGSGVLADTGPVAVDETVPVDEKGPVARRGALEGAVLQASSRGIRTIVVRPGLVYGRGGSGFMQLFIGLAQQARCGRTIGDGQNVCSVVHVDDLGDLFLLALERGPASALYNAASEEEPSMLDMASAIGRALGLKGEPSAWPVQEARQALGPFADGMAANKRISAGKAVSELGWSPHHPGLVEDIETGSYAAAFKAAEGQ
ncbi:MAG: SDR family oxidoreductase [Planctomycetota bacterium]